MLLPPSIDGNYSLTMTKPLKIPWPGQILASPALWIQSAVLGSSIDDGVRRDLTASVFLAALERQVDAADQALDDVERRYRREKRQVYGLLAQARAEIQPLRVWTLCARATATAGEDLTVPPFIVGHAQSLATIGARIGFLLEGCRQKPKRDRPGRPRLDTEKQDATIRDLRAAGVPKKEIGHRLGMDLKDVELALGRQRKRDKKRAEKPSSRG